MVARRFEIEVEDEAHWKAVHHLHAHCSERRVGIAAFDRHWRFEAESLGYYRRDVPNTVSFIELSAEALVEPIDEQAIFRGQVDRASFTAGMPSMTVSEMSGPDPLSQAIDEVMREIAPTTALRMSLAIAFVRLKSGSGLTDPELQGRIVKAAASRHIAVEFDLDERPL
jgi:hypothetical protein